VDILLGDIRGYFRLNYHKLLVVVVLVTIGGYFINDYSINGHWWLFY
jgi:hypothetical protein